VRGGAEFTDPHICTRASDFRRLGAERRTYFRGCAQRRGARSLAAGEMGYRVRSTDHWLRSGVKLDSSVVRTYHEQMPRSTDFSAPENRPGQGL